VAAKPSRPTPVSDLDWEPKRAREIGERALDIWEELLERLPGLPIARDETQPQVRAAVTRPVPEEPLSLDELAAYLREVVLEHSMYPGHPGFMAYISGTGTVPGAAADLIAAAVNQNAGGWLLSPAATEIELHLTRWFAGQFGLPASAGGMLTSGGAMANFIGLKAARDAKAGWDVRREGILAGPQLVIYASDEVHATTHRAADMLGIGRNFVRAVETDDDYRMRVTALREAIAADVAAGLRPIAVTGTAGTVATGAVDPLDEIADVCAEHGLWFHVDGAYGGPAVLVPELRPLFAGIERADSIGFDPHKWLYTPHSGGCVLVRDMDRLSESFAVVAGYIYQDKESTGRGIDLGQMGPQFSRGFQALKVWVSLLAHGRAAYVRRIAHDVELARYIRDCVSGRDDFEPGPPVTLSIACFRYVPPDLRDGPGRDAYLDELNARILTDVQLDGRAYCSNAILRGRFWLRACIVNFRTEAEHTDTLLEVCAEHGARLDAELRPEALR
jgi:glutamate/tyrosine decarboxylase-like PLP-dependent enzyme